DEVNAPVLLVHGDRDWFIPLSHSETLLERAQAPAELLVIEGAGHNDIHRFPTYLNGLAAALPN
ncbi:MAG: alpha/beta hydrolase, partial [Pseudomonadota bacterium]